MSPFVLLPIDGPIPPTINYIKNMHCFDDAEFEGIDYDGSGNVYMAGRLDCAGAGSNDFYTVKRNTASVLQWERALGGAGSDVGSDIAYYDDNNIYVVGYTNGVGAGSTDAYLTKYNSSGTVQWERLLGTTLADKPTSIALDSSGNIYFTGTTAGASIDVLIAKYNPSGTLQWQRRMTSSGTDFGTGITVNGSSVYVNILAVISSIRYSMLAKYDTSGTYQWHRALSGGYQTTTDVDTDSSGNIYVVGSTDFDTYLAKYDSSGNLQWQRLLDGSGSENFQGIHIDASDNIFCVGNEGSHTASGSNWLIARYNTAGVLQWQRSLASPSLDGAKAVVSDNAGTIYVAGWTQYGPGSRSALLASLPDDGTGVGVYSGVFTYSNSASSLSDVAGSMSTPTVGTIADASLSLTAATTSQTNQSVSLTETGY